LKNKLNKKKPGFKFSILNFQFSILSGCVFYAAGIALFLDKNDLAPGGVSGFAIALNRLFGDIFNAGTIIALINVPLLIIGTYKFGIRFLLKTGAVIGISSLFINILEENFAPPTTELLLASIIGGALMSLGLGLIIRGGGSTGGGDIIVRLLQRRFRHIKTGAMFLFIDGVSVAFSGFVFKNAGTVLYAAITLFVQTLVLDAVLYGTDSAKLVYVISEKEAEIAKRLMCELEAGATYIKAAGAYSGGDKKLIMCVVKKRLLPKLRAIVSETDRAAFMIVTKATEIFGEGFKGIE